MKELIILHEKKGLIKNPKDIFKRIEKIDIDFNQENVLIFFLDSSNDILNVELLFKGGLNSCLLDPKTIYRRALINNASCIIMAHNHPSGNLKPSEEDINVFNKIKRAGNVLSLKCLDSIIFNQTEFYSIDGVV